MSPPTSVPPPSPLFGSRVSARGGRRRRQAAAAAAVSGLLCRPAGRARPDGRLASRPARRPAVRPAGGLWPCPRAGSCAAERARADGPGRPRAAGWPSDGPPGGRQGRARDSVASHGLSLRSVPTRSTTGAIYAHSAWADRNPPGLRLWGCVPPSPPRIKMFAKDLEYDYCCSMISHDHGAISEHGLNFSPYCNGRQHLNELSIPCSTGEMTQI